jgi:hypothetical protein
VDARSYVSRGDIEGTTIMRRHYLAVALMSIVTVATLTQANAQSRGIDASRAAAIKECSTLAQRYPETTFGSTEYQLYRSCMAQHGQVVE